MLAFSSKPYWAASVTVDTFFNQSSTNLIPNTPFLIILEDLIQKLKQVIYIFYVVLLKHECNVQLIFIEHAYLSINIQN